MKKLENSLSDRYYKGLEDLPVLNWWKLHEENDFKWLIRNEKKPNIFAKVRFKKIKHDFINTFGVDDRYANYLDKLCEIEMLKIDIALNGDRTKEMFVKIAEFELEDMLNEKEAEVYNHGIIHIEKYMGFKLDTNTTTVYEFYSYVKEIEKQLKHVKSNGI